MAHVEARRACRHRVKWPARVRSIAETQWHPAQVLNLSVTGVLLQTEQAYEIGERVEVEIDFLTQPEIKTVVTGVGYVVREDQRRDTLRRDSLRSGLHADDAHYRARRARRAALNDFTPSAT